MGNTFSQNCIGFLILRQHVFPKIFSASLPFKIITFFILYSVFYDTYTLLIYILKGISNGILNLLHCSLTALYRQQERKDLENCRLYRMEPWKWNRCLTYDYIKNILHQIHTFWNPKAKSSFSLYIGNRNAFWITKWWASDFIKLMYFNRNKRLKKKIATIVWPYQM